MNAVSKIGAGILDVKRNFPTLSHLPDTALKAEIARRNALRDGESTCGSRERGDYNLSSHVMALFLILVLSTLACSFPILARRFPRFPVPHHFLFISRHFGTGVLIATAFVHLLPTAFVSLTDPCLPPFWNESFPAMAGFVAMVSVFVVISVEMFFASKGAGHVHGAEYLGLVGDESEISTGELYYPRLTPQHVESGMHMEEMRANGDVATLPISTSSERSLYPDNQRHLRSTGSTKEDSDTELEELEPYISGDPYFQRHRHSGSLNHSNNCHPSQADERSLQADSTLHIQNPQRQLLQCLLLEAGILFHSIFIGMAVSVATGTSFIVLLVAISFHQTFEGFALGSRIASLIPDLFSPSSIRPWLMSLAYGTTTPIGQALGLVLHNFYDPASSTGLLMVGITNAISSGLLLFAGLVELLAEDFLSESSYQTLRGKRRIQACIAVASGAVLMSFVGAWA
ncbi:hypothetical protein MAP00_003242 [Monascus purpureus]|nr:hypothetical protein MAP00_003242 [Monascus purpureus]